MEVSTILKYYEEKINEIISIPVARMKGVKSWTQDTMSESYKRKMEEYVREKTEKAIYIVENSKGDPIRLYYKPIHDVETKSSCELASIISLGYNFSGIKYPTLIWVWEMNLEEKTFGSLPRWSFGYGKNCKVSWNALPFRFKPALGYWEYDDKYRKEN